MTAQSLDTGTLDLIATLDEGVLTLTLNRPEARNAMSKAMNKALQEQLAEAEFNPAVKCLVLTGAGKGFCAGGDVKGMAASGDGTVGAQTIDEAIARQRLNQRATAGKLFKMPKPTIAALPGAAAGAGLSLALACDLRVMASNAIMTTAFARVGFSGDYGGTYFLTQLVGSAKAREMYFTAEVLRGDQAHALGLVNRCVPLADLAQAARAYAQELAALPTVAIGYMKRNLNAAGRQSLSEVMDTEAVHMVRTFDTDDHKNAALAFVDKREPQFQGR